MRALEAVRDAVGRSGMIRIDANGGWTPDEALEAVRELNRLILSMSSSRAAASTSSLTYGGGWPDGAQCAYLCR
jgi:hypothetical protein